MSHLATNLQLLRGRNKRSQDDVAFAIECERSTYSNYEAGISEPRASSLVRLADHFRIHVDTLIRCDLRQLPPSQVEHMQREYIKPATSPVHG